MGPAQRQVNTVEAKNRLNELIAEVGHTKVPVIVEKRGKPVAVVMDYQSYLKEAAVERVEKDQALCRDLLSFHKIMRKKYPSGTGDSVEILREARDERFRS